VREAGGSGGALLFVITPEGGEPGGRCEGARGGTVLEPTDARLASDGGGRLDERAGPARRDGGIGGTTARPAGSADTSVGDPGMRSSVPGEREVGGAGGAASVAAAAVASEARVPVARPLFDVCPSLGGRASAGGVSVARGGGRASLVCGEEPSSRRGCESLVCGEEPSSRRGCESLVCGKEPSSRVARFAFVDGAATPAAGAGRAVSGLRSSVPSGRLESGSACAAPCVLDAGATPCVLALVVVSPASARAGADAPAGVVRGIVELASACAAPGASDAGPCAASAAGVRASCVALVPDPEGAPVGDAVLGSAGFDATPRSAGARVRR